MNRNWHFYILKRDGVSERHAFNLVSPSVILKKHLEGYEKRLIGNGYIADKLRIDYWLNARGKFGLTSQSNDIKD